jgi:hypothetical protein
MDKKHPALSGGHHAILTAEDPRFPSHPGGNDALENELKAHNLDFSKLHGHPKMAKNEDSGTILVHYSNKSGLKEISPGYMGTAAPSQEYKRNLPEVARAYYYHGSEPENIVTQGAKSKYHVKLDPHHNIYDLSHDAYGHVKSAIASNQGVWDTDKILGKIKEAGSAGFKNPSSALPNVVALFHSRPVVHE